jgi:hypothetical protein
MNPEFRQWFMKKQNFLVFSVLTVGIGSAALLVWNLGHNDMVYSLFLIALGLLAGLLWGLLMWELVIKAMLPPDKRG